MTETEKMYRNEETFDYAKMKNNQFYIENNDDDDEIFESFESENEIFDQKVENQSSFKKKIKSFGIILFHIQRTIHK